nr:MAG TPA: hypothetical protein [Caudoviricetes sp.]
MYISKILKYTLAPDSRLVYLKIKYFKIYIIHVDVRYVYPHLEISVV